jgi:hypothetical protein
LFIISWSTEQRLSSVCQSLLYVSACSYHSSRKRIGDKKLHSNSSQQTPSSFDQGSII